MPIPHLNIILYPDKDPRNADWIKTVSWDFPVLPQDEAELVEFLDTYLNGETLEHFKTMAAYEGWLYTLRKQRGQSER